MPRESDAARKRRRVLTERAGRQPSQIQQAKETPEPIPPTPAPSPGVSPPEAVPPPSGMPQLFLSSPPPNDPPLVQPAVQTQPEPDRVAAVAVGIPVIPDQNIPPPSGGGPPGQTHSPAHSEETPAAAPFRGDAQASAPLDLMRQVVNTQRLAAQYFYLVLLPEDGHPEREQFDNVEDMIARIRELVDTTAEVSIFPFMGNFLPITQGPNRFLVTPYGSLPLFQLPDLESLQLEKHGYVGPADVELPTAATPVDPAAAQARLSDEETTAPAEVSQGDSGDDEQETPTMQGMSE